MSDSEKKIKRPRGGASVAESDAARDDLSFENALAGLEARVEALRSEGTTLADAMRSFEEGMTLYRRCAAILDEAKQKISYLEREEDEADDGNF